VLIAKAFHGTDDRAPCRTSSGPPAGQLVAGTEVVTNSIPAVLGQERAAAHTQPTVPDRSRACHNLRSTYLQLERSPHILQCLPGRALRHDLRDTASPGLDRGQYLPDVQNPSSARHLRSSYTARWPCRTMRIFASYAVDW
jgi:hypothetical protein